RVRNSTPCATHSSVTARTVAAPCSCPLSRGSPRSFAQRPLPSMMIAMCRGDFRAGAAGSTGCVPFVCWIIAATGVVGGLEHNGLLASRPDAHDSEFRAGEAGDGLKIFAAFHGKGAPLFNFAGVLFPAVELLVNRLALGQRF